ncbi:hypothetical protein JHK82_044216 [Glycine max]|nr:hypothetical protein JHK82_044216 [Glycine max]
MEVANSQEESAISEQTPNGDTGEKPSPYVNSRKRKGKSKETSTSTNPPMGLSLQAAEASEDSNAKRNKPNKGEGNENGQVKAEEESKGCNNSNANDEKQSKSNSKLPEPPKDCIHVRARRGQATDSRSLAERGNTVACVMARQDATPDVRQCTTPFGRGHGDATEMQANGRGHNRSKCQTNEEAGARA